VAFLLWIFATALLQQAESLIVRLEVALDSARLVNPFERDDQVNAARIPHLESLVRQLQILSGNVRNNSSFVYISTPHYSGFAWLVLLIVWPTEFITSIGVAKKPGRYFSLDPPSTLWKHGAYLGTSVGAWTT